MSGLNLGLNLTIFLGTGPRTLSKTIFVGLLARGRCPVGHWPLCSTQLRHNSKMPRNHIAGSVCAWLLASDGISFFVRMSESEPDAPHQILVDANRIYRLFQRIRNRVDVASNRQSHLQAINESADWWPSLKTQLNHYNEKITTTTSQTYIDYITYITEYR